MHIQTINTKKIVPGDLLEKIIDFPVIENSILVVTSKIVSICQGRVVKIGDKSKKELIEQESQYFIPSDSSKYDISMTITRDILIPTAGIDESNGNGYYILWPNEPFKTAQELRSYLVDKYKITDVGIIISDSKTTPRRWGTTGTSLAHAGFDALNNYIGEPDIFGHNLRVTKANIADGLAAAAVVAMGEGNEQTPLALLSDMPFVHFDQHAPTQTDIKNLTIASEDDLYYPLLKNAPWEKGKGR